jgi:hypothetical protein
MRALEIVAADGIVPERHADRVTGLMMSHLARQSAHLAVEMRETAFGANDGNPRAQRKLEQRLQAIGTACGRQIVQTSLRPGKRGQYRLACFFWSGWDSNREREIVADAPMPPRPWLCWWYAKIESPGRGYQCIRWRRRPLCFISHHILSRMAQRCELRTVDHMLDAIAEIALRFMLLMNEKEDWLEPPPAGWRVELDNGATMILQKYEERPALIAVTCF